MPMKNPPHPGGLVKTLLEELDSPVAQAARALGVTRQQLYNVVNERSAISPEMAVRLEKAFGGTADVWLRMQAVYDLSEVRKREGDMKVSKLAPAS